MIDQEKLKVLVAYLDAIMARIKIFQDMLDKEIDSGNLTKDDFMQLVNIIEQKNCEAVKTIMDEIHVEVEIEEKHHKPSTKNNSAVDKSGVSSVENRVEGNKISAEKRVGIINAILAQKGTISRSLQTVWNYFPDATAYEIFNVKYGRGGNATVCDMNFMIKYCIQQGYQGDADIFAKLKDECGIEVTHKQIVCAINAK